MEKTVITIVGKDKVGIIAKSSTYLSNCDVNILDIAQTTLDGIFNMMMIVDIGNMNIAFDELLAGLRVLAEEIGVDIRCQKEEIFDMMHRI